MTRERFSIPYFVGGDTDALIERIPSCISEKEPAKYEPTTVAAYHLMRHGEVGLISDVLFI